MNELQKLNCPCVQVDRSASYATDWANVSKYKFLRITVYSEVAGHLHTVFSVDGVEKGVINTFKVQPKKWETHKVEVICNYLKFEFVNGNEVNQRLLINVLGRYSMGSTGAPQSVKIVDDKADDDLMVCDEPEKKEPLRSKSPFRKFVERKQKHVIGNSGGASVQKVDCYDPRLPSLLLRGNMLIVTGTNQLGVINPPVDDTEHILLWSNGKPQWKNLSEFSSIWQI